MEAKMSLHYGAESPSPTAIGGDLSCSRAVWGVIWGAIPSVAVLYADYWMDLAFEECPWKRNSKAFSLVFLPYWHLFRTTSAFQISCRCSCNFKWSIKQRIVRSARIYLSLPAEEATEGGIDDQLKYLSFKLPADAVTVGVQEVPHDHDQVVYYLLPAFKEECMAAKEALITANVLPDADHLRALQDKSLLAMLLVFMQTIFYFYSVYNRVHKKILVSPVEVISILLYVIFIVRLLGYMTAMRACSRPLVLHLDRDSARRFVQRFNESTTSTRIRTRTKIFVFLTASLVSYVVALLAKWGRNWSSSHWRNNKPGFLSLTFFTLSTLISCLCYDEEHDPWRIRLSMKEAIAMLAGALCLASYVLALLATIQYSHMYREE